MRDKINLTADIYFSSKEGIVDFNKKYHAILIRSPYKKIPSLGTFPFDIDSISTGMDYVFINNAIRGIHIIQKGCLSQCKMKYGVKRKMEWIQLNG